MKTTNTDRPAHTLRLIRLTPMQMHAYAQAMALRGKSAMKGVA